MDAQKRGAIIGATLDDALRLLHAPERLLGRIGEHRAEPAGHALAGEEAADGAQALFIGGVHVDVGSAVRVNVDEAGQYGHALGVELGQFAEIRIGTG